MVELINTLISLHVNRLFFILGNVLLIIKLIIYAALTMSVNHILYGITVAVTFMCSAELDLEYTRTNISLTGNKIIAGK